MSTLSTTSLSAYQGDTYVLSVTWKDSDGNVRDITGASAEFGMAPSPGSSSSFQYSDSDYLTITGASGKIELEIPHTETRKWDDKRYHVELTVTLTDGTRTTIMRGILRAYPEIVE